MTLTLLLLGSFFLVYGLWLIGRTLRGGEYMKFKKGDRVKLLGKHGCGDNLSFKELKTWSIDVPRYKGFPFAYVESYDKKQQAYVVNGDYYKTYDLQLASKKANPVGRPRKAALKYKITKISSQTLILEELKKLNEKLDRVFK